jgi:ketosteroid isomerase-like protein
VPAGPWETGRHGDTVRNVNARSFQDSPVDRFFRALGAHDVDELRGCLHPDFEMVVPQKPLRGFAGRDQEIANMRVLFDTYPDGP